MLFSVSARADDGVFGAPWDAIFGQGSGILFGTRIDGPRPDARNAGAFFKPASLSKLFTTMAALDRFGAGSQFETRLEWRPTDQPGTVTGLALLGSGDPSWGMSEFGENYQTRVDAIAVTLRNRGVTRVEGPVAVRAADSRFARLSVPQGWEASDRTDCYGALGQGFNLQINCASFELLDSHRGRFQEAEVPIHVQLQVAVSQKTALQARRVADGFLIVGTWNPSSGPQHLYLPVDDVTEWVRRLFLAALARNGIAVDESATNDSESDAESLSFYSPKLSEILQPFLKKSLNPIGDSLFRMVGASAFTDETDLTTAGQRALQSLTERLGLAGQARLFDGSGLSQDSQVTPDALVALLRQYSGRADFSALWDALPIAGVDGTLEKRMKGTAAQGLLRAKTGTLTGTYNLAGYVPVRDSGGRVTGYSPFVILTQTTEIHEEQAKQLEDQAAVRLVQDL